MNIHRQEDNPMRRHLLIPFAGLLFLAACNSARKPSDANFATAINQYLATHGRTCALIGNQFPADVPKAHASMLAPRLAALEQAGLVHGTDTTAVVHGMLDVLRGPTAPQPVRRYELTAEGQRYFQQTPGPLGTTYSFCYGQKAVDSIVRWTQPTGTQSSSQSEVTYTYKLVDLAVWAQRPDMQQAFPDIQATISGASKANQVVGLQLTNEGWEIPGS
jgi:hypothetical protein